MCLREQYNNIFKALFDLPCSPSCPKPHTVASYFVFLTHWPHSRHLYSHTRPTALEITAHCDHTESHTHHGWSDEARIRVPSRPRVGQSRKLDFDQLPNRLRCNNQSEYSPRVARRPPGRQPTSCEANAMRIKA